MSTPTPEQAKVLAKQVNETIEDKWDKRRDEAISLADELTKANQPCPEPSEKPRAKRAFNIFNWMWLVIILAAILSLFLPK